MHYLIFQSLKVSVSAAQHSLPYFSISGCSRHDEKCPFSATQTVNHISHPGFWSLFQTLSCLQLTLHPLATAPRVSAAYPGLSSSALRRSIMCSVREPSNLYPSIHLLPIHSRTRTVDWSLIQHNLSIRGPSTERPATSRRLHPRLWVPPPPWENGLRDTGCPPVHGVHGPPVSR